jgi:hypothetical protein
VTETDGKPIAGNGSREFTFRILCIVDDVYNKYDEKQSSTLRQTQASVADIQAISTGFIFICSSCRWTNLLCMSITSYLTMLTRLSV